MYLIRQLALKYRITRTTLLHYDAIKLLSPQRRNSSGYRLYSEEDEKRLQRIILFRSMGLSLNTIQKIFESNTSTLANILLIRLDELNNEIKIIKKRQESIINLIGDVKSIENFFSSGTIESRNKALFQGIDPLEWHKKFEESSPENHRLLLNNLEKMAKPEQDLILKYFESVPSEMKITIQEIIGNINIKIT